jgi:hypothetical protein
VSRGRPNDGGAHSKVAAHIRHEHADILADIAAEVERAPYPPKQWRFG